MSRTRILSDWCMYFRNGVSRRARPLGL
jgi:hypothetical protein